MAKTHFDKLVAASRNALETLETLLGEHARAGRQSATARLRKALAEVEAAPRGFLRLDPKDGDGAAYVLEKRPGGQEAVWITVDSISVHLKRGDDGVSVHLFPVGKEDEHPLASTWLSFAEAEESDEGSGE